MDWNDLGAETHRETENFSIGNIKEIDIPGSAVNIQLQIEVMTFPPPRETWKTILTESFGAPPSLGLNVSGTTLRVSVVRVS